MEVLVVDLGIAVHQGLGLLRCNVLVQGAAKGHVDQLQTAAHAKHWFAGGDKSLHQRLLIHVADAVAAPARVQRCLAIAAGPDIGAAVQHQAVQPLGVVVKVHLAARGFSGG